MPIHVTVARSDVFTLRTSSEQQLKIHQLIRSIEKKAESHHTRKAATSKFVGFLQDIIKIVISLFPVS